MCSFICNKLSLAGTLMTTESFFVVSDSLICWFKPFCCNQMNIITPVLGLVIVVVHFQRLPQYRFSFAIRTLSFSRRCEYEILVMCRYNDQTLLRRAGVFSYPVKWWTKRSDVHLIVIHWYLLGRISVIAPLCYFHRWNSGKAEQGKRITVIGQFQWFYIFQWFQYRIELT